VGVEKSLLSPPPSSSLSLLLSLLISTPLSPSLLIYTIKTASVPSRERTRIAPSSTVAVNRHAQFKPHKDSGSGAGQGVSLIVGLGDFSGGETVVEGVPMNVRYSPLEFNGWTQQHWTLPFEGERFSLVWFTPKGCEGMRKPLVAEPLVAVDEMRGEAKGSEGGAAIESLDCGLENILPVNLGGLVVARSLLNHSPSGGGDGSSGGDGGGGGDGSGRNGVAAAPVPVYVAPLPAPAVSPAATAHAAAPAVGSAVVLSSGFGMPVLGFGTFHLSGEQCTRSVANALRLGYRAIDTAASYRNHAQVGEGIARSGLRRGSVFITSKVPPQSHGRVEAYRCCLQCLKELDTDYIDLLLIHWPGQARRCGRGSGGSGGSGAKADGTTAGGNSGATSNEQARLDTWLALQDLYFEGRCR
jgi:hypothetical protein